MAILAKARRRGLPKLDLVWSDDGMVLRFPETNHPLEQELFTFRPEELEAAVSEGLTGTSLFAARFRENAARALLLPRRQPGRSSPLWLQRKRAADLLSVASRYPSFPILLETFRDCLRDVFDVPALERLLGSLGSGQVRLLTVDSAAPSPFAAALLFSYVANFIYDADAPLAERRAQALTLDHARLRELLGEAELRELLDPEQIALLERRIGRLEPGSIKSPDTLHDALLELGPLTLAELSLRALPDNSVERWLDELIAEGRVFLAELAGGAAIVAAEDAGRLRALLGTTLPDGLPEIFCEPVADALGDLVLRHARTHGPFAAEDLALRFGLELMPLLDVLSRLESEGRLIQGEFVPGGQGREWCDVDVLRSIKQRSLAELRRRVEPVEPFVLARFACDWQGVTRPRRGADGLASCLEQLQGAPLVLSALEQDVLPLRVAGYSATLLDALAASGEIVWRGIEPLGTSDARIAFYFSDQYAALAPAVTRAGGALATRVRELLAARGALFFWEIATHTGAFSGDLLKALWELVFAGEVSNDTLAPLRSLLRSSGRSGGPRAQQRSRRAGPPGSEGRWSLLPPIAPTAAEATPRAAALATVLLERHGIVTREAVQAEGISGGFSAVYPVLKAMEQAGRARRGYFVAGLGATQFAAPGADERLRLLRDRQSPAQSGAERASVVLAATDPAQPYGAALPWPELEPRPMRAAGALVVLHAGRLIAYLGRGGSALYTFLPSPDPERRELGLELGAALSELVERGRRRALLIASIDGARAADSELAAAFKPAGFVATSRGLFLRPSRSQRELSAPL